MCSRCLSFTSPLLRPEGDSSLKTSLRVGSDRFILQGIASIKFYDEEGVLLLQLITCRPPPTQAGLRFVALGLCMLIACPTLIGIPEQEQRGLQWVFILSL